MIKDENTKILVIHGPNMNLLGLRMMGEKNRITLDKLNRHLRITSKEIEQSLTIIQTNDESRAVNHLQNQRRKIIGLLLFPGPWQQSGHVMKDTLNILSIPCITVSIGEKVNVFKEFKNVEDDNLYKASEKALKELVKLL